MDENRELIKNCFLFVLLLLKEAFGFLNKTSKINCPFDVLIPDPIPPCHSQTETLYLSTLQPQFCYLESDQTQTLKNDAEKLALNWVCKEAESDLRWKPLCEEMGGKLASKISRSEEGVDDGHTFRWNTSATGKQTVKLKRKRRGREAN